MRMPPQPKPLDPVPHENQSAQHHLTVREYAAIHLKVPDSGVDWLDKMIEQSRLDDFAKAKLV